MQKNPIQDRRPPRRDAEHNAPQPIAGQPRSGEEEDEGLEDPNFVPSLLTARELQARDPAPPGEGESEDRDAGARVERRGRARKSK